MLTDRQLWYVRNMEPDTSREVVKPRRRRVSTDDQARIAITGGTGFVGRHLARALSSAGYEVVLIARGQDRRDDSVLRLPGVRFVASDLSNAADLARGFEGCGAVAHCAGINREVGSATYQRVHVEGTAAVVEAAREAQVGRIALLSFLRARPDCGSAYHESKWAAEELVRKSGIDYTVIKAGMIYGLGDHMLDHLSHTLFTLPVFATVGIHEQMIRPAAVDDIVDVLMASLLEGHLRNRTVLAVGPDVMQMSDAVRMVAEVLGRKVWIVPAPVWFHRALSAVFERTMRIPLISRAQVQMLAEGFLEPAPYADRLPQDLEPWHHLTADQIRKGLPEPGGFKLRDLRCSWAR
jgi:uncharacterized protein YbjT (DUF2867 family)